MKFLNNAHSKANQCRQKIGISSENLLDRVESYIGEIHQIELSPCHKDFIDGGKAEIRPLEGCLYYDEELNSNPEEKLSVIIHELGHLELHSARLTKFTCKPDPLYSSMYSFAGTNSLTRYNPRSLEEVEANAFAAEFLCPCAEAFQLWRSSPNITVQEIADRFGAPIFIVRSQLADALYRKAFGTNIKETEPAKEEFDFNQSQIDASEEIGVPVLVDAGPGTGKTATLVRRIEFLLSVKQVEPSNILVLTFSNEACNELYERIASKFDEMTASQIRIATFHGFGLSLVQLHGHFKNLDVNTCVIDEFGQRELVNEILGKLHNSKILKVSKPEETVKEIIRHITFLKERMIMPEHFKKEISLISSEETNQKVTAENLLEAFEEYEKLKFDRRKLDFADLIQKSIEIFDSKPGVLEINREQYQWILVDEYQDVSRATAILLQKLCGKENPPWVVGDKRQSIFRFCGAHPENMDRFEEDFPNAKKFTLKINYRSSEPLIKNKNDFAVLMNGESSNRKEIWQPGANNPTSQIEPTITFAGAESDEAERNGILEQIQFWLKKGIQVKDIAVLTRRNTDVRNIVLTLNKNHIPAVASGVVTAEGAAGDLANVITLADSPVASIPRLVYCLGKGRYEKFELDDLIARLLESYAKNKTFQIDETGEYSEVFNEVVKTPKSLSDEKFNSDAFSSLCIFLFESSNYLRQLLNTPDEIEKALALNEVATILLQSLALNEIVTTLTEAASYRFSHQELDAHISRKSFAKYFRESLSQSTTPTTSPPSQLNAKAVKVMTCHAAKGLEFPFVVVAGQTLSEIGKKGEYQWLPVSLCPKKEDDLAQADSTLFVGVSRAKQGLVISYAKTSSGLPNSRKRKIVPLLQKWSEKTAIKEGEWNSFDLAAKETFETEKIWGGKLKYPISSRKLDKADCSLATYLQDGLLLKFPLAEKSFYPTFYVAVRQVLNSIVKKIFENQGQITHQEAIGILTAYWDFEDFRIDKDHIHHNLYWSLAQRYINNFVDAFIPETGKINFIDLIVGEEKGREIQLDLVCAYTVDGASPKAIFFRPESLKDKLNDNGKLLWSKVDEYRRIPFVLLREDFPDMQIKAFSGTDGALYDFLWASQIRFIDAQKTNISNKFEELSNEKFIGMINTNNCDYRCENRINCPFWIGALSQN